MHAGTRLGRYEVLDLIGQGGMGEVWRARDTSLGRDVAIKTLPPSLSQEPDRLARLTREASLLAAVNHPNIAVIHGLEEHDGTRFIVLELVDGETLAHRMKRGPLAVSDALKIAGQIADALAAAHAQGVVHRDLKPGNIMVAPGERVKVLDFGLAKAAGGGDSDATRTALDTIQGTVLGTPAYMSPEQARGEAAGFQSDIWALGVVVFEMLTGTSPFKRDSGAESIAAVLTASPDFSTLPAAVPVSARRALTRCLERDLNRRFHHVLDARLDFEDAQRELASPAPSDDAASGAWRWIAAAAIVVAIGLAGWIVSHGSPVEAPREQVRLSMVFAGRPTALPVGTIFLALSPDGSHVAFTANTRLWLRDLTRSEPVSLATEQFASNPFFSPDGRWVGYFDASGVKKSPVAGGPALSIAATSNRPSGGTWHGDRIVFASTEGLHLVSADGGDVSLLKAPDRTRHERLYAWPQFLPDGRRLLFTIVAENGVPHVALLNLDTIEQRSLITGGSSARYVDGTLVYAVGAELRAVRFDLSSGTVSGEALPLADVAIATSPDNGAANFALGDHGTLVFSAPLADREKRRLTWIDRRGNALPLPLEPQSYSNFRLAPDGKRIAAERFTAGSRDIWIVDPARGTETQLTDGPTEDLLPVWSPDSGRVWFASDRTGNFEIYSQAADGATPARLELAQPDLQFAQSFTPDGGKLLYYDRFRDMRVFELAQPGVTTPLLDHPDFDQRLAQVSPDGNWVAYESNESGSRFEIFVRPFVNINASREQISTSGGRFPVWGPKGSNELYYVTPQGAMMAVTVRTSPTFHVGAVTKLFDARRPPPGRSGRSYDVSLIDGRFLLTIPVAESVDATTQLNVILHFADRLAALNR